MTNPTDADAERQTNVEQPDATAEPQKLLKPGYAGALNPGPKTSDRPLPFLRHHEIGVDELRRQLTSAPDEERRQLMTDIVSFAPWEMVWDLLTPQQLQLELEQLDLSANLKEVWQRWLATHAEP